MAAPAGSGGPGAPGNGGERRGCCAPAGGAARGGPGAGGGAGPALGGRGGSGGHGQRGPGSGLAPVPAPRPGQRSCHTGQCPAGPALLAVRKGSGGISAGCEIPEGRVGTEGTAGLCWVVPADRTAWAHTERLSERKEKLFSEGG